MTSIRYVCTTARRSATRWSRQTCKTEGVVARSVADSEPLASRTEVAVAIQNSLAYAIEYPGSKELDGTILGVQISCYSVKN